METVGGRIKYYRKLHGVNQSYISKKICLNRSTYIRYESASKANHDVNICKKICEVIGIDPKLVFDDYMLFITSDYRTTLRMFRKKNKLTHEEFGKLIGMNGKISAKWENGRNEPTRASYQKIKELFAEHGEKI